eukprot:486133-Rhodomonas_salina.1
MQPQRRECRIARRCAVLLAIAGIVFHDVSRDYGASVGVGVYRQGQGSISAKCLQLTERMLHLQMLCEYRASHSDAVGGLASSPKAQTGRRTAAPVHTSTEETARILQSWLVCVSLSHLSLSLSPFPFPRLAPAAGTDPSSMSSKSRPLWQYVLLEIPRLQQR